MIYVATTMGINILMVRAYIDTIPLEIDESALVEREIVSTGKVVVLDMRVEEKHPSQFEKGVFCRYLSPRADLNRRPTPYQGVALPPELRGQKSLTSTFINDRLLMD